MFPTMHLPAAPDATAPDGSDVRVLLRVDGASMAHFTLAPGAVSTAVRHRTVEEIWYVLSGSGSMWRAHGDEASTVALEAGVCVLIPLGAVFQCRANGTEPLCVLGVTTPPWPGDFDAIVTAGPWSPTVR